MEIDMDVSQHPILQGAHWAAFRQRLGIGLIAAGMACSASAIQAADARKPASGAQTSMRQPTFSETSSSQARQARLDYANESVQPQIKYAYSLADRGAVYSAKARFIDSLRTIARVLDSEQQNPAHEQALFRGLTAMREADDLQQLGPSLTRVTIERLVVVHKTPVLKQADFSRLTPAEALRAYYLFAERHLIIAGENVPAASQALYGLGRIEAFRSTQNGLTTSSGSAKALLFYQSALAVDASNHAAANEIGVILARSGRLDEARRALEHSVTVLPQPESWHNLSEVYSKLGNVEGATFARRSSEEIAQAQLVAQRDGATGQNSQPSLIRWVNAEEFAQSGGDPDCTYSLRKGLTTDGATGEEQPPKSVAASKKGERPGVAKAWSVFRGPFGTAKNKNKAE